MAMATAIGMAITRPTLRPIISRSGMAGTMAITGRSMTAIGAAADTTITAITAAIAGGGMMRGISGRQRQRLRGLITAMTGPRRRRTGPRAGGAGMTRTRRAAGAGAGGGTAIKLGRNRWRPLTNPTDGRKGRRFRGSFPVELNIAGAFLVQG